MNIIMSNVPKNLQWIDLIFKDFVNRSLELEGYGFGNIDQINSEVLEYPYLWVDPDRTRVIRNTSPKSGFSAMEIEIDVIVADKLRSDVENEVETISDVNEIILSAIAELSQHPYYVKNNVSLSRDIDIVNEWRRNDDIVNRAIARLTLRWPFSYTYCSQPVIYTGLTPSSFSCDPASIKNTDFSYSVSVVSGGTLILPDMIIESTGTAFSDTAPSVSTYIIQDVIWTDTDGLTYSSEYGSDITCTPISCSDGVVYNSDLSYTASVISGGTLILPDMIIESTGTAFSDTAPSVSTYIIPDFTWTDSDGLTYSAEYGSDIVATPCTIISISATSSTTQVVYGDYVTFSVQSSSVLTQVDWYVDGEFVGNGQTFSWNSEYLYGEFDVVCVASDGSSTAEATFQIEIIVRPYERPSDWLDIDSLVSPGDEKIVGLFAIFDAASNVVAFRCQGNYTVDWGDGTITNHTSNTTAEHSYLYSSFSSSTDCSRGYRQAIITITPQAGQNITKFDVTPHRHSSRTWLYNEQWLDIKISAPNMTTHQMNAGTSKYFMMLEKYVMIATAMTSYLSLMSGNRSLRHLEIPAISGSYGSLLINCSNLEYFNHDFSNATTVSNAFQGSGIRYLNADLSNAVIASAFYQAYSLMNVDIQGPVGSGYDNLFYQCYSLRKANITGTPTSTLRMFASCTSLETPPDTLVCTSITNAFEMFSGCAALKRNLVGTFSVCTSMSTMYSGCKNIVEIDMFDMGACQNATLMFNGCSGLRKVPTLDTSNVTNNFAMFSDCYSLVEIGNLDFSSVTRWGQPNSGAFYNCISLTELPTLDCSGTSTDTYGLYRTFQNMYSLRKLNLTNTGAIIGWQEFCRSNFALQEIGPCDMSSATNLSSAFNGCYNLRRMQGTGIKVDVSFQQCSLDAQAIDEIFTNLAVVVGKTIIVSQNPGSATCTTSIATLKGWMVVT